MNIYYVSIHMLTYMLFLHNLILFEHKALKK